MQPEQIRELLEAVKAGSRGVDEAFTQLAELPFTDIGDAKIDNHRPLRCGFAEVVLCRGKEPRDVMRIVEEGMRLGPLMLCTRAEKRHIDAVRERYPNAYVNARGGIVRVGGPLRMKARGSVVVVTAGTSDIPVAEEALETLRAFGCDAFHNYDVGVAGLHRVLAALPQLRQAAAIICVAGMEGALPSVIGGLVACPVIAVPSSIGYGASFNGVAALLGMLNTCSAGVTVVNIDNGFGAAMCALRMVADRDYPIIAPEAPAAVESVSAEDAHAEKSAARDAQLERLEKAVDQLTAMAQRPVVVEAPKIEFAAPDQTQQFARLERAIAELATISAKQKEAGAAVPAAATPEQAALLDRAIAELNAAASRRVEAPASSSSASVDGEWVARLERTVEQLAAAAAKPVVVELKEPPRAQTPPTAPPPPRPLEKDAPTQPRVHVLKQKRTGAKRGNAKR